MRPHTEENMKATGSRRTLLPLMMTAVALGGCGHGGRNPETAVSGSQSTASRNSQAASAGSAQASTAYVDPQLTPLTTVDIDLYLDVMRAAAARVRHPTPADLAAIKQEKDNAAATKAAGKTNAPLMAKAGAIQKQLQAAMQSGDVSRAQALAVAARKQLQATSSSLQVVAPLDPAVSTRAMNLSSGQADLQIVAERHLDADRYGRIVSVIEEIYVPPGTAVGDCGDCRADLSAEQLQHEKVHEAGVARNKELLAPYAGEIRSLQAVVRSGKS